MKQNKAKPEQSTCKEEPLIQMPRKRAMGWLVIFCFISVWIFFLGILVGRGMAPVQFDIDALQKELTDLRLALIVKQQQLTKSDTKILKGKPDFQFHENLKESKPDTSVSFQKKPVVQAESDQTTKPAHKKRKLSKKKPLLTKTKKPKPLVPKKSSAVKTSDSTEKNLTIQVASLRDPKVADQLVASLKKKGFPAYKTIGIISENNIWYRVRAGYFKDKQESKSLMAKLKKIHKGAILIKR